VPFRLKLLHRHLQRAASHYWAQVGHDRTAIESAIKRINDGAQKEIESLNPLKEPFLDFIARSHEWVMEALLQGAFIREYHLWEKHVREYVANQRAWNGRAASSKWHHDFIVGAELELAQFGAQLPVAVLKQLRNIRRKVNKAKHEPGLSLDHFVTHDEFFAAIETFQGFWEGLSAQEEFQP
jgi:hypothetical protein